MAPDLVQGMQGTTIAAMVALAVWLLTLRFASRVNQSLALFLLLGAQRLAARLFMGGHDPRSPEYAMWHAWGEYASIGIVPSIALFFVAYARPAKSGWWRGGIVLTWLVCEVMFFVDHCLGTCSVDGIVRTGPLSMITFGRPLAFGVVALALAIGHARDPTSATRRATLPVALILALTGILEGALFLASAHYLGWDVFLVGYAPSPWTGRANVIAMLGLGPSLAALLLPGLRRRAFLVLATLALASGLGLPWLFRFTTSPDPGILLLWLWRLALPAALTYAVVRHRLFGQVKPLRWAVRSSTIAAIGVAGFFAITEIAASFFADVLNGTYAGIVAASALIFALAPLQRFANRVAVTAIPDRPTAVDPHHREVIYQSQVEIVWSDGVMGTKEFRLLRQLRENLGLTMERAHAIEARVLAGQQ